MLMEEIDILVSLKNSRLLNCGTQQVFDIAGGQVRVCCVKIVLKIEQKYRTVLDFFYLSKQLHFVLKGSRSFFVNHYQ